MQTDNREWAAISGDWLQGSYDQLGSKYNPYSTAPNSPHILWKKQVSSGGLPGGDWGSLPYSGGGGSATVVMDGKIYQSGASGYFDCIDLRTGQKLWSAPGSVTSGERFNAFYQTASQLNEGAIDQWIWGLSSTAWVRYDTFDGRVLQNITKLPSGSLSYRFESDASPIAYITNWGNWNTTRPLQYAYEYLIKWNWTMVPTSGTGANDWTKGIVWNVSIRQPNGVGVNDGRTGTITPVPWYGANVVTVKGHNDENYFLGFDMTTGAYLYKADTVIDLFSTTAAGPNGPYVVLDGATQGYYAYNVKTGKEAWKVTPSGELPWAMVPANNFAANWAKGVLYYGQYEGHVYAVDIDTGEQIWQSDYYGDEDESIYGTQPYNGGSAGADGKVYFSTSTTYSLMPRTRFHALVAIDEDTGDYLWKLPIGASPRAIAEGYLIATDSENGMQYCIGRGKTETTVTAQPLGTGMIIQGTVMDSSPAAPNTPAVSDADMSEWMDYLHGQNATLINSPPAPSGVPVELRALGSDGTVIELGTVTSDSSGHYNYYWNSSTAGIYTVYAAFPGSESYWSSSAEITSGIVASTTTTTLPETVVTNPDVTTYVIVAAVAIIIAIAVATVLILKKGKP